ncbi:hypothetical protein [Staphylococcus ureilyticus]|uniref:hypothetical protein n=1 Tax=Staphylococcus ureilyticus TaxID=94138 RepID=UPI0021D1FCF9|nr:hypothetical protein [Staphylococcus ureilyticus]MDU0462054.1 hypothetical protein [Staphylococcus ureilyticus]UXS59848.1 hypothetical protein MUA21_12215 [Staphylococcus ureilyticus]
MSMPTIVMLILTIMMLLFVFVFGLLLDKPVIYMFIALFVHSTLLFIIRYFWQGKEFGQAFTHSFDLITITIVIIFTILKVQKAKSSE